MSESPPFPEITKSHTKFTQTHKQKRKCETNMKTNELIYNRNALFSLQLETPEFCINIKDSNFCIENLFYYGFVNNFRALTSFKDF